MKNAKNVRLQHNLTDINRVNGLYPVFKKVVVSQVLGNNVFIAKEEPFPIKINNMANWVSAKALQDILWNRPVHIRKLYKDSFNRMVSDVELKGKPISHYISEIG